MEIFFFHSIAKFALELFLFCSTEDGSERSFEECMQYGYMHLEGEKKIVDPTVSDGQFNIVYRHFAQRNYCLKFHSIVLV